MIIISEAQDKSTDQVIEWLYYYKKYDTLKRTNVELGFEHIAISINNENENIGNVDQRIWIRRGHLPILPIALKNSIWYTYLKEELSAVYESFEYLQGSNLIGSYQKEFRNNKLINLKEAQLVGLKIPATIVVNNKNDLLSFIKEGKRYITKSIFQSPYIKHKDILYYGNGTIELDVTNLPMAFAPSLIQEYVEKEVEIRVFFIEDEIFSMAIFSQLDEETSLDFRNGKKEKPNRIVPFALPKAVLEKLKLFIKNNCYTTGSVDIILTPEGEFFFLEINPMGQYDWMSHNCNYYIDKKIAEIL